MVAATTRIDSQDALQEKGIRSCIPGGKSRIKPINYDKCRYRSRIEILFDRRKDWHRVATRQDRCSRVSLSAIVVAAAVNFWL